MFGIGGFELFIILLFGFLIFGPDKLPQIAKTVGQALAKFRKAQEEMNAVLKQEVIDPGMEAVNNQSSAAQTSENDQPKESFAQRKARYDKERAERKLREEQQANRQAMKDAASERATRLAQAADHKPEPRNAAKPTLSASELYGTTPVKPAPRSQQGGLKEAPVPSNQSARFQQDEPQQATTKEGE